MRTRYCKVCGEFHDLAQAWPAACVNWEAPASAPSIRPDGMDATRNHADGKTYDSKSAYYKAVRRAGCEIVGNDPIGLKNRPEYQPQGVRDDLRRALAEHGVS